MDDLGIDLATDNDTLVEGPEDYRLTISAATSTTGATVVLDTVTPATIVTTTITDNDTATWSLTGTSSLAESARPVTRWRWRGRCKPVRRPRWT